MPTSMLGQLGISAIGAENQDINLVLALSKPSEFGGGRNGQGGK